MDANLTTLFSSSADCGRCAARVGTSDRVASAHRRGRNRSGYCGGSVHARMSGGQRCARVPGHAGPGLFRFFLARLELDLEDLRERPLQLGLNRTGEKGRCCPPGPPPRGGPQAGKTMRCARYAGAGPRSERFLRRKPSQISRIPKTMAYAAITQITARAPAPGCTNMMMPNSTERTPESPRSHSF